MHYMKNNVILKYPNTKMLERKHVVFYFDRSSRTRIVKGLTGSLPRGVGPAHTPSAASDRWLRTEVQPLERRAR